MSDKKIKVTPRKDATIAAFVLFILTSLCNLTVYNNASKGLLEEIQHSIMSVAKTAAKLTNVELHETLQSKDQTISEDYLKVRKVYDKILEANSDLIFIYTIRDVDGKPSFVIDTQTIELQDPTRPSSAESEAAHIGQIYKKPTPQLLYALENQTNAAEDKLYIDEWGTYISAYAPLVTKDNKFVGIVGVDMNATEFNKRTDSVLYALIAGTIISLLLSICTYIVILKIRTKHKKEIDEGLRKQELMDEFNSYIQTVVTNVSGICKDFETKAVNITEMAKSSAEDSRWAAVSVNDTVKSFQATATSTSKLTYAAENISKHVNVCNETATKAYSSSSEVDKASSHLIEVSSQISGVVDVISDIAERIHLLAMNAKIEAAAAGEYGKGFAVVAVEIKQLADQTLNATNDITKHINSVYKASADTAFAFDNVTKIIASIKDVTTTLNQLVGEQEREIRNIADNIHNVNDKTSSIVDHINSVTDVASRIETSTHDIQSAVSNLVRQRDSLNEQVNVFLEKLKG